MKYEFIYAIWLPDAKPILAGCVTGGSPAPITGQGFRPTRIGIVPAGTTIPEHYRTVPYSIHIFDLHSSYRHSPYTPYQVQSTLYATIAMPRRVGLFSGHTMALGLSVFLFTFMFLPTLLVLLAVVVFFLFCYPRLRKAEL